MVDKQSRKTALKIVEHYLADLKKAGVQIKIAILFGSYAKGNQHKWSDIDLALVADNFTGLSFIDKEPFRFVQLKKEYTPIETHTFATDYFEKGDAFIDEIKQTGIRIL